MEQMTVNYKNTLFTLGKANTVFETQEHNNSDRTVFPNIPILTTCKNATRKICNTNINTRLSSIAFFCKENYKIKEIQDT